MDYLNGKTSEDVFIQDQTTPPIILPMVQRLEESTLAVDTVIGSYTITLIDIVGFIIGQHIRIINNAADRFYYGNILDINGTIITVDTQIDFTYVTGSEVTVSNINMAVDGSVTPVIFTARTGTISIPSEVDITSVIFSCTTDSAINLSLFGDLPALKKGFAFRKVTSIISNIFNIKTNSELANIAYDFDIYSAINPAQGVDGFVCRLTFAGQNKMGVVLRIPSDGNLETLVQDDLSNLTNLQVILEGHIVQN